MPPRPSSRWSRPRLDSQNILIGSQHSSQQPLKIFLVGTEFVRGTGGIQYVNRLLLRALLEISGNTPCDIEAFSYSDSAATLRLDFPARPAARLHAFDRQRIAMAAGLSRRLAASRPDLVLFTHVGLLRMAPLVRLLAPNARVAVLGHGVEVWDPLPWALRRELQAAEAVVAPSQFTRGKLIQVNGVAPEKVTVLAHGLDPDFTQERVVSSARDPNLVLAVARLNRADIYKGLEVAIAAMPRVVSRCPQARLLIAGDGDDRPRLQQIAAALNLAAHIEFCSEVSGQQLRHLYQQASVFVMPSKGEGFGIVFLEAMHHGLPVVAARAAATEEVLVDGITGILVPPDDAASLGSAISGLLLLDDERDAMGAAARCRVAQGFLFPDFVLRWQRWIAEVCPEELYLARHAAVF